MWRRMESFWKAWKERKEYNREDSIYVEGMRSLARLRAVERSLSSRIDALELYVDDVTEKYLKKGQSKARYAKEKEEELMVEPINGFETIRQKYGGRE